MTIEPNCNSMLKKTIAATHSDLKNPEILYGKNQN